jgi:hypothetical protein
MRYLLAFLTFAGLFAAVGCTGSPTKPIVTAPPSAGPDTSMTVTPPPLTSKAPPPKNK